jgi:hypothetical protein
VGIFCSIAKWNVGKRKKTLLVPRTVRACSVHKKPGLTRDKSLPAERKAKRKVESVGVTVD